MNSLQRRLVQAAVIGCVLSPLQKLAAQGAPAVAAPTSVSSLFTSPLAPSLTSGPRKSIAAISASIQSFRDSLVARARAQIGTRYKLGAASPERGFDCSGLVSFVAKAFDIALPRTARQQAAMGVPVPKDLDAMKPGDLLTFGKGSKISHIGIYVGEGRFVHASTTSHRVIETSLVGTRSPLIKQWKGVRRMADGNSVKLRDSVLAMLDSIR
ncbi:MAG: C40 family peptidase [Gemmatimonadaceae bacterium]